jgi:transposase
MHIASIGIDLGKTTFHLVALGERSKILLRKKFSRAQLLAYTANLPSSLVGLEACSGAHFLGARLREQGHDVRLIPAQFIKPYRKSNKNDFIDAEAIAEAVGKENMRFVPIKSEEQLDVQAMHRVRDRLVQGRTALINEIRGFLLERGMTFAVRPTQLRKKLPEVIEDAEQNLSSRLCWDDRSTSIKFSRTTASFREGSTTGATSSAHTTLPHRRTASNVIATVEP